MQSVATKLLGCKMYLQGPSADAPLMLQGKQLFVKQHYDCGKTRRQGHEVTKAQRPFFQCELRLRNECFCKKTMLRGSILTHSTNSSIKAKTKKDPEYFGTLLQNILLLLPCFLADARSAGSVKYLSTLPWPN